MAEAPHILIVEAPYYAHIAEALLKGAVAVLDKAPATYERPAVPGAVRASPPRSRLFAEAAADRGIWRRFDGYVALGCVIRGETTHYQHVCEECARGVQTLALDRQLAIGFGVLTVENEAQALARSQIGKRDKGGEAAQACLAT